MLWKREGSQVWREGCGPLAAILHSRATALFGGRIAYQPGRLRSMPDRALSLTSNKDTSSHASSPQEQLQLQPQLRDFPAKFWIFFPPDSDIFLARSCLPSLPDRVLFFKLVQEEAIISPYALLLAGRAGQWRARREKWATEKRSKAITEKNSTARLALGALDVVNTIASSEKPPEKEVQPPPGNSRVFLWRGKRHRA